MKKSFKRQFLLAFFIALTLNLLYASESNISLSQDQLNHFRETYHSDAKNSLAEYAVSKSGFNEVGLDLKRYAQVNRIFSHEAKEQSPVTNQKKSGRCWLFAGLNLMRDQVIKSNKLNNFEFSQNYLFFWDKLEKSNYFLNSMIQTRAKPINDRTVQWLLKTPINDGGQWDMFINLVTKYGLVPKSAMPETYNSCNSREMNKFISAKLREDAYILRQMSDKGISEDELMKVKLTMIDEVYKILAIYLGEPPQQFDWAFKDREGQRHFYTGLTPLEFSSSYIDFNVEDKICLINAPQDSKPFGKHYSIRYLGNIVEGKPVRYINVSIEELTKYTKDSLANGEPVWFGCDIGKSFARGVTVNDKDFDVLDTELLNYELVFGTHCSLDKGTRLDYGHSHMTHSMIFTAVNLHEDRPDFWFVENSWGQDHGNKGYLTMSQKWFEEYVYEVAIDSKFLSKEIISILDEEAIMLEPWDPMGSLARAR